jgi:hypothetical protein
MQQFNLMDFIIIRQIGIKGFIIGFTKIRNTKIDCAIIACSHGRTEILPINNSMEKMILNIPKEFIPTLNELLAERNFNT